MEELLVKSQKELDRQCNLIKSYFCQFCNPINPSETGDCKKCQYAEHCAVIACQNKLREAWI